MLNFERAKRFIPNVGLFGGGFLRSGWLVTFSNGAVTI